MSSSKKSKAQYDREYKDRIVQEYLRCEISAKDLAEREGLDRGQIYNWKIQCAARTRSARIEDIADSTGLSLDQARQIQELQEELEATQKKLAQTILECDLLKKIQPNSLFERKSSGYIETKKLLARSRGRAK